MSDNLNLTMKITYAGQEAEAGFGKFVEKANQATTAIQNVGTQATKTGAMMGKYTTSQLTKARGAVVGLNYVLRDSPYMFQNLNMGIMAIGNNINPLIDSFIHMKRETGSMKGALGLLKSQLMGPLGLTVAFSLVVAAIQAFSFWMAKSKRNAKNAKKEIDELNKAIKGSYGRMSLSLEEASASVDILTKRERELKSELKANKKAQEDYVAGLISTNQIQAMNAEQLKDASLLYNHEKEIKIELDDVNDMTAAQELDWIQRKKKALREYIKEQELNIKVKRQTGELEKELNEKYMAMRYRFEADRIELNLHEIKAEEVKAEEEIRIHDWAAEEKARIDREYFNMWMSGTSNALSYITDERMTGSEKWKAIMQDNLNMFIQFAGREVAMAVWAEHTKIGVATQGAAKMAVLRAQNIAGALKSAGSAMVGAVARLTRWMASNPLTLAALPAAIAGLYALFKGAKKMFGFAKGGIATGPMAGMIAEAGSSEAVIPLNDRGASFMAQMMGKLQPQQPVINNTIVIEGTLDGQKFLRKNYPDYVKNESARNLST